MTSSQKTTLSKSAKTSLYFHSSQGKFDECPKIKLFHNSPGLALQGYLTIQFTSSFINTSSNSFTFLTVLFCTSIKGIFFQIFGITILLS